MPAEFCWHTPENIVTLQALSFRKKKLQGEGTICWYNFLATQIVPTNCPLDRKEKERSVCCVRAHRTKVSRFVRTQKKICVHAEKGDAWQRSGGGSGQWGGGGDSTTTADVVAISRRR